MFIRNRNEELLCDVIKGKLLYLSVLLKFKQIWSHLSIIHQSFFVNKYLQGGFLINKSLTDHSENFLDFREKKIEYDSGLITVIAVFLGAFDQNWTYKLPNKVWLLQ